MTSCTIQTLIIKISQEIIQLQLLLYDMKTSFGVGTCFHHISVNSWPFCLFFVLFSSPLRCESMYIYKFCLDSNHTTRMVLESDQTIIRLLLCLTQTSETSSKFVLTFYSIGWILVCTSLFHKCQCCEGQKIGELSCLLIDVVSEIQWSPQSSCLQSFNSLYGVWNACCDLLWPSDWGVCPMFRLSIVQVSFNLRASW